MIPQAGKMMQMADVVRCRATLCRYVGIFFMCDSK